MNIALILLAVIDIALIRMVLKQREANRIHVYRVVMGEVKCNDHFLKIVNQREYKDTFLKACRKRRMIDSINNEIYGKPKVYVKTDIFGIPTHIMRIKDDRSTKVFS